MRTKPIDYPKMLKHIAAARGCPDPNPAQTTEMERALGRFPAQAVDDAVAEWLATDTQAIRRLPYPGELLPLVQARTRILALAERAKDQGPETTYACPVCLDCRMVLMDEMANTYAPCRRCNAASYSRWKRGHFDPKHNAGACLECIAVKEGKAIPSAIASLVDDDRRA